VWLPRTTPTIGAIAHTGNKTFVPAYEFPSNAAERRAIERIAEVPALSDSQIRDLLKVPQNRTLASIPEEEEKEEKEESNTGAFKEESLGLVHAVTHMSNHREGLIGAGAGGAAMENERQRKTRFRKRQTQKRKTRKRKNRKN